MLGCIADDFTGATDLGALLRRTGRSVRLYLGIPPDAPPRCDDVEVVALKIRTIPTREAVAAADSAAEWLMNRGAGQLYWKYCSTFDSTADGNIGPVSERLMQRTGAAFAVYCPTFPENNRTVYKGNLFVGDLPLSESSMRDHPLTPMRDSNLVRLLKPQVSGGVGLITLEQHQHGPGRILQAAETLHRDGVRHIVLDAITGQDLCRLGRELHQLPFLSGGSAFAAALPCGETGTDQQPMNMRHGATVIFSGSCSAATRAQVAGFEQQGGKVFHLDPMRLDADGMGEAEQWLRDGLGAQPIMISSSASPDAVHSIQDKMGIEGASTLIEHSTGALARTARDAGANCFIVAGGETSGAVSQALDIQSLRIGPEIAPGVPWCFATDQRGTFAITLKSGNFGGPHFFEEAIAALPKEDGIE